MTINDKPIVFKPIRVMSSRQPHAKGCGHQPEDGQFVKQLAHKTECGVKISGTDADGREQNPYNIDSAVDCPRVLLEQLAQQSGQYQE